MTLSRPRLAMIAAMSRNGVIGKDGALPWHYPEDLKHFRTLTVGHTVIMGRKTYESIGRPLPKRLNIVVSRSSTEAPSCIVAPTLERAIEAARHHDPCPFIIGGAQLYQEAMPFASDLYLTRIDRDVEGDTFFPEVPERFTVIERAQGEHPDLSFLHLKG